MNTATTTTITAFSCEWRRRTFGIDVERYAKLIIVSYFQLCIGKQFFNICITETDEDGNDIWEKELIEMQGGTSEKTTGIN